jgi:hypothetical protein
MIKIEKKGQRQNSVAIKKKKKDNQAILIRLEL